MALLELVKPANADWQAQKIVLYGVQGIGKTTFGSTFENAILAPVEDGAGNVNIQAFPKIESYNMMVEVINELHGDHPFKTLVVDSLDWLEPLVWAHTCAVNKWESIEDPGYGKGYVAAQNIWRYLMDGFDSLRTNKGMNIVMIAHTHVKQFKDPSSEPYDRYETKLQQKASAIWEEWADMVLFVNYRFRVAKDKKGESLGRAHGQGERVVYTEERPAFKAKNRWSLPEEIVIGKDNTWGPFHDALSKATGGRYKNKKGEIGCPQR